MGRHRPSSTMPYNDIDTVYPTCRMVLGPTAWDRLRSSLGEAAAPGRVPGLMLGAARTQIIPDFLPELARLEWARHQVATRKDLAEAIPAQVDELEINPTLEVLQLSWRLVGLLTAAEDDARPLPVREEEWALVWRTPDSGETSVKAATDEELLVIKMLVDEIEIGQAAAEGGISAMAVQRAINHAAE